MGREPEHSSQSQPQTNAPSTQQESLPDLSRAKFGAHKLIEALSTSGCTADDLARVTKAVDIMFELHRDQTRPDGAPYVNHTLLVTQVLSRKFGITDPAAVVAALLHDAPEDQTPRISETFGEGKPITEREAISLLCKHLGVNDTKVAEHLTHLTNPDFKSMVLELKNVPHPTPLQASNGYHLFALTLPETERKPETIEAIIRDMPSRDVKNKLYLGHWIEILNGDPTTRAIKLADFYTNGLQRHRLHQHLDTLQEGSPEKDRSQQFAENLRKKYGPVVSLIELHLTEAVTRGENLVSTRGDLLIGRQIGIVAPLYVRPYGTARDKNS